MAIKTYGVHDQWPDLSKINNVEINSTDGIIDSIKINDEEQGGGGSGDFSTANVTIKINAEDNPLQNAGTYVFNDLYIPVLKPISETITRLYNTWTENQVVNAGTTNIEYTRSVPLYKGYLSCINALENYYIEEVTENDSGYYANAMMESVTGSASINGTNITITGDCVINLKVEGSV